MLFYQQIREQGNSLIITIPYKIVKLYNMKPTDFIEFEIKSHSKFPLPSDKNQLPSAQIPLEN